MDNKRSFKEKYGPWALVTGASSGIGAEFARQLAEKGLNVAVAARRKNRLETLVDELQSNHGVRARALAVDLTAPDYLEVVDSATEDIEIGLLVNNAGAGIPGAFMKHSLQDYTGSVQLNVMAPMQLAHAYGTKMSQRGRGGIIFVSSVGAYVGAPYMANYIASKAYLLNLGAALHVELKPKGVDVLVLSPGPTRTEMAEAEGVDFSNVPMNWMKAGTVAAAGLRALGRKSMVVPGGMNKMMVTMMTRVMPRQMALSMFGSLMSKTMDPALL